MFYYLVTNTNSPCNELIMEDYSILIIIMLLKSDKGFGSGKKHELDIFTKFVLSCICYIFTYNISHCESNMYPSYYPLG